MDMPKVHSPEDYLIHDIAGETHCCSFLNSVVVPRPIAFVTSLGPTEIVNAAPFSYFNVVSTNPPIISLAIERRNGERKDTSRNIILNREFVVNICSIDLAKAVSIAGGDFSAEISEIDLAKLSLLPSEEVSVPRIANSLIHLECILYQVIEIGNDPTDLILGQVVKCHIHKHVLIDGYINTEKLNPLARVSGPIFAKLGNFFEIQRGLIP